MGLRSFLSRRESLLETPGGRQSRGGMRKCQRKNALPCCSSSGGGLGLFHCHLNSPSVSPRGFWRKQGVEPGPCAVRSCSSPSCPSTAAPNWAAPSTSLPSSWDKTRCQLTPLLFVTFLVLREVASRPAQLPWCRSPHASLHLWSHTEAVWVLTHL